MLACLLCLPFVNDEVYQAIICLHIVWGRIKPLKCSISVNDLELYKNVNYYAVKDIWGFSGSWCFVFIPLVMDCEDDYLQRQSMYNSNESYRTVQKGGAFPSYLLGYTGRKMEPKSVQKMMPYLYLRKEILHLSPSILGWHTAMVPCPEVTNI